jgi:ketosteroid isomerase-like protein
MTKSDETLEAITKVFAAFDAHDLDAFHALLAPDAVFVIGGGERTLVGPDAIVDGVRPTLEALPDLKVSIRNAFADGERGVAEVMREGVNNGAIRRPDGTVRQPTGRKVRLAECVP